MVAHDYIKYLDVYGKRDLFVDKFWLRSIFRDLFLPGKVWSSEAESQAQVKIFFGFLDNKTAAVSYYCNYWALRIRDSLVSGFKLFMRKFIALLGPLGEGILQMSRRRSDFISIHCLLLDDAIELIDFKYSTKKSGKR